MSTSERGPSVVVMMRCGVVVSRAAVSINARMNSRPELVTLKRKNKNFNLSIFKKLLLLRNR